MIENTGSSLADSTISQPKMLGRKTSLKALAQYLGFFAALSIGAQACAPLIINNLDLPATSSSSVQLPTRETKAWYIRRVILARATRLLPPRVPFVAVVFPVASSALTALFEKFYRVRGS